MGWLDWKRKIPIEKDTAQKTLLNTTQQLRTRKEEMGRKNKNPAGMECFSTKTGREIDSA
jgi:hypothetical protein